MLAIQPEELVFPEVEFGRDYVKVFLVTNSFESEVTVSIRSGAPTRYSLSPSAMTLAPGQSMSVSLKLRVNSFPNRQKGEQGQRDILHIKTTFFDQKIPVVFYLKSAQLSSAISPPSLSGEARARDGNAPRAALLARVDALEVENTNLRLELENELARRSQERDKFLRLYDADAPPDVDALVEMKASAGGRSFIGSVAPSLPHPPPSLRAHL